MRWFWIDRFTEFVSGQRATAIKNVSMGEEHLSGHFPGYPCMPPSLIVEGLAQTGGLLMAQQSDFRNKVVLAKVGKATFHRMAVPGDQLIYRAEAASIHADGAIMNGTCHVDGELLAEVQLFFAFLGAQFKDVELFDPATLGAMLTSLRVFEIGVDAEGNQLSIPDYMSEALASG